MAKKMEEYAELVKKQAELQKKMDLMKEQVEKEYKEEVLDKGVTTKLVKGVMFSKNKGKTTYIYSDEIKVQESELKAIKQRERDMGTAVGNVSVKCLFSAKVS